MLPAYAGMIRLSLRAEIAQASAPRVCGDDPSLTEKLGGLA